jgi:hypothetical protein
VAPPSRAYAHRARRRCLSTLEPLGEQQLHRSSGARGPGVLQGARTSVARPLSRLICRIDLFPRVISPTSTRRSTLASLTRRYVDSLESMRVRLNTSIRDQSLHVFDSGNGLTILARKPKSSPHAVKGAFSKSTVRNRSGGRRSAGVISSFAKRGYRADLRKVDFAPLTLRPFGFFSTFSSSLPCLRTHDRRPLEPTGLLRKAGRGCVCKSRPPA